MTVQFIPAGGVDRIPDYDPRTGEHYWICPLVFHVADPRKCYASPDTPMLFDKENLVLTTTVGCYYCEEPYSDRLYFRRCKGEP